MAIDPSNLTVDYRQLMRMTVADRISFAKSPQGQSYLGSLTPVQLARLFPGYWKKIIPISTGTGSVQIFGAKLVYMMVCKMQVKAQQ